MTKINDLYRFLYQTARKFNLAEPQPKAKVLAGEALKKAILENFLDPEVGREYRISLDQKQALVCQFQEITKNIQTATNWLYYVILATVIFQIPKSQKGGIIECGCWKGGSTAMLSLIAEQVERKLYVADSFEGIPSDDDQTGHFYPHLSVLGYYRKGMYDGTLAEVKANVKKYGKIRSCQFIKGFYAQSLKNFSHPLVFAFLDVDLRTSLQDSVKYLWPKLADGAYIYTDDSCDMDVVRFWFDKIWWQKNLKTKAPGYVGSGCGLPINPDFSSLGYARKIINPEKKFKRENWFDGKVEE